MFRRDGRDEVRANNGTNYAEVMMPFLAMSQMKNHDGYGHGNHYEHWDIARDELKEFGEVKKQIAETGWREQIENAKYFYEQQKTNLLGFKDVEIQGLKNTAETVKEVRSLRDELKEDKLREQGNRLNYLETVMALQPKPIPAAYPVHPPVPYSPHATHVPPCGNNAGYHYWN
jgi:hypothetical protein